MRNDDDIQIVRFRFILRKSNPYFHFSKLRNRSINFFKQKKAKEQKNQNNAQSRKPRTNSKGIGLQRIEDGQQKDSKGMAK